MHREERGERVMAPDSRLPGGSMRRDELSSADFLSFEEASSPGRTPPLDGVERRVVRQFVEALLYEKFVPYRVAPSRPRASSPRATGTDGSCEAIYDQRFDFEIGARRYSCDGTVGAFDRVRIRPGSIVRREGALAHEVDVFEFVDALSLEAESSERLAQELAQTTAIGRYNQAILRALVHDRRRLGFEELEGAIIEGHLYHPSFKSRTGFTLRDHEAYSGEGGDRFQVEFLAILRREVRSSLPAGEPEFWTEELGALAYAELMARLEHLGKNPEEYALVPAHPHQLCALKEKGLDLAVRSGRVVPLGRAGDLYRGTQSLRTLTNFSNKTKANLKLPLDVFCTSCRRNFRKHFVCTAPVLSEWLTALVKGDPFLQQTRRVDLLSEYAAILWDPELGDGTPESTFSNQAALPEGAIGAIFRKSVSATLGPGESAVPFTALALEEADGRPFASVWLTEYGTEAWVARLIEVTVVPIWHMLVHHGVAFEAHAQNLILVHRDGWPERIVLRDFHEDTEFVPGFLRDPASAPDFASIDAYFAAVPDDDGYRMGSVEDLRQLYMDTVYVFNLTEVSFLLHRHGILAEARFWHIVRRALDDYAAAGVTDPARSAHIDGEKPRIVVESLLRKTTERGNTLDFFEHEVRNTLGR